ncbi:TetR/AcrR family transcriptional regulator [Amycolatopsis aidingensis]|uniref:TetR/AcrR family transcriptional regulator n=1 Tax=Amycolatopsis aidingensis TaxID=2842453 RepID=UPI001C0E00C9|nr:TetR/AcrR family transcriptional regulator [Amycolatopsis aidingensis]
MADHIERTMRLLWQTGESPKRGPKPGLTVSEVVRAAIDIADAEGLDALSMRRVAERLGIGTMSLYTYVPGKAELLDLMLDAVTGERRGRPGSTAGWRERVLTWARADWELYHRHEWVLRLPARHPLGPNALAAYEAALRALLDIGLTDGEVAALTAAVDGYVRGVARTSVEAVQRERDTGIGERQRWAQHQPALARYAEASDYPAVARVHADAEPPEVFETGLRCLLDGIAARIAGRARR